MSERKEKFTQEPSDKVNLMDYMIAKICDSISTIATKDERMKKDLQTIRNVIKAAPEMLEHGDEVTAFLAYLLSRDMLPYPYNKAAHSKIEKWKELSKKARGEE